MDPSLKELGNNLRRYGIDAEDAFNLIGYVYLKELGGNIDVQTEKIRIRGHELFSSIERDPFLVTHLKNVVHGDPQGENLPIWYQFFLSSKFRGLSGKFFTPRTIAGAMAGLLPVKKGAIVMDPTCGGGTFLKEVSKHWGKEDMHLVGNDIDAALVELTRLSLDLGISAHHTKSFTNSDIYEPTSTLTEWGNKVDYILANPPFSLRIKHPVPGKLYEMGYKTSDAVFIDICRLLLKPGGMLVCLLPHSIIANADYRRLREAIELDWNLKGIIGMPEGIFHTTAGTTARADIVMLEKKDELVSKNQQHTFFGFAPSIGIPLNNRAKNTGENELQELVKQVHLSIPSYAV